MKTEFDFELRFHSFHPSRGTAGQLLFSSTRSSLRPMNT